VESIRNLIWVEVDWAIFISIWNRSILMKRLPKIHGAQHGKCKSFMKDIASLILQRRNLEIGNCRNLEDPHDPMRLTIKFAHELAKPTTLDTDF